MTVSNIDPEDNEPVEGEILDDTSTEIVVRESNSPARIVGGIPYLNEYLTLSNAISRTAMVPPALRNRPEETLAVMMYGAELGIGPMQALQQIEFIAGKPSAKAELLRALVMEAGHQFIISGDRTSAVARAKRKDWADWEETTFTIEDAGLAGLLGKEGWKKYPDQMLTARVTSKACRMWFADVISGMSYVPEDIESFTPTPPPQAKRTGGALKSTQPVTTTRSAPVHEVDQPTDEEKVQLATALSLVVDDHDREAVETGWRNAGLPPKAELTSAQSRTALAIVRGVLNAVPDDDAPETGNGAEGHTGGDESQPPKGGLTKSQVGGINSRAAKLGLADREAVHARIAEILGVPCESVNDLTKAQASKVIDTFNSDLDALK